MKEQPFAWVETIHHQLSEMKMIPLTGNGPKFPFKEMEHRLTALLEVDSVKIEMEQMKFLPFNDLLSGSGENPLHLPLELPPLQHPFLVLFPRELVKKVTLLSVKKSGELQHFSDPKLQEGYFRYLTLQAIDFLVTKNVFEGLSLQTATSCPLPEQGAFCINVTILINDAPFAIKILCPTPFINEWRRHYAKRTPSLKSLSQSKSIAIPLSVSVGKTRLSLKELESLEEGDFIFLDDAQNEVLLNGKPLFKGSRENETITITDYA